MQGGVTACRNWSWLRTHLLSTSFWQPYLWIWPSIANKVCSSWVRLVWSWLVLSVSVRPNRVYWEVKMANTCFIKSKHWKTKMKLLKFVSLAGRISDFLEFWDLKVRQQVRERSWAYTHRPLELLIPTAAAAHAGKTRIWEALLGQTCELNPGLSFLTFENSSF